MKNLVSFPPEVKASLRVPAVIVTATQFLRLEEDDSLKENKVMVQGLGLKEVEASLRILLGGFSVWVV